MEEIETDLYQLLKDVAQKKTKEFSGLGIVVYDKEILKNDCHCDLRPNFRLNTYNVKDEGIVDKLIEYSSYKCDLHDGFCFMEKDGTLTHVAQYYVPNIRKEIYPNQSHGVRTYSAACGSDMEGVLCIGIISSNNDIYIYKNGKELINDNNFKEEK